MSVKEELLKLENIGNGSSHVLSAQWDKLSGIVFCHVDEHFDNILISLRKRFVAGKVEERNFNYIGFRITQGKKWHYIRSI